VYFIVHPSSKSVKNMAGLPEGWLAKNAGDERQRQDCL
jgi:hypothetical protein